jgi:hypothetical protein
MLFGGMIVRSITLFIVIGVALVFSVSAAGPAQAQPNGSYLQSCRNRCLQRERQVGTTAFLPRARINRSGHPCDGNIRGLVRE